MEIPYRGTLARESAELTVHLIRALRLRQIVRWLNRQSWVAAYADWDAKHVPSWLTPMNVVYAGVAAYGVVILAAFLTR